MRLQQLGSLGSSRCRRWPVAAALPLDTCSAPGTQPGVVLTGVKTRTRPTRAKQPHHWARLPSNLVGYLPL